MTPKTVLIAVAMLVIGAAIGGALTVLASSPQQQGSQAWEYKEIACASVDGTVIWSMSHEIVDANTAVIPDIGAIEWCSTAVARAGIEGWELFQVWISPGYDGGRVYLFKQSH